jgi:Prokaryotic Cytochrome C oxidase subunit IV
MTVLIPLLRTRTSAVWLLLTAATVLSWSLGANHGIGASHGHELAALSILVIVFVKIRFVGLYFMELRGAPLAVRSVFEIYCAAVLLALSAMYLLS